MTFGFGAVTGSRGPDVAVIVGIRPRRTMIASLSSRPAAFEHDHYVTVLDEFLARHHADRAQYGARGEIRFPGNRNDPFQPGLFVTEAQRCAGGFARQTTTVHVRPKGEP